MKLPLFISVPHAGIDVPIEVSGLCALKREAILADSDIGAQAIYFPLQQYAMGFCTTTIARSVLDLNRAPDDIGGNGVIKSHTLHNVPVFKKFPDKKLIKTLLDRYYFPYHARLTKAAGIHAIKLGLDCHTMSPVGPPVGPDPEKPRPMICLSNGNGTCPDEWLHSMAGCLARFYKGQVSINTPFQGGHIIRSHALEMNWMQIEISQSESYPDTLKRKWLLEGLQQFCHTVFI